MNTANMTVALDVAGWHAIGNPFVMDAPVESLQVTNNTTGETLLFKDAVKDDKGWAEPVLYRWAVNATNGDAYQPVVQANSLAPWEGYWLKTKVDNLTLTIPAPEGVINAPVPLPDSFLPPAAPVTPLLASEGKGEGFDLRFQLTSAFASNRSTRRPCATEI